MEVNGWIIKGANKVGESKVGNGLRLLAFVRRCGFRVGTFNISKRENGLTGVLATSPSNSSDNSDRELMSMALLTGSTCETTTVRMYSNELKNLMLTWEA